MKTLRPFPERFDSSRVHLYVSKVRIDLRGMFEKNNIFNDMKHCIVCGRQTPYIIYYNEHRYGWRVCWKHLPDDARDVIKYGYGNIEKGDRIFLAWPPDSRN